MAKRNGKPEKETKDKSIIPEEMRPEKPKDPPGPGKEKEKKRPILPTKKLTKSQRHLWGSKFSDIEAMKQQAVNIVAGLGMEIKRNLVETFAEELGIEIGKGAYGFDNETMTFIDGYELMKKQGQPRNLIPGRNN